MIRSILHPSLAIALALAACATVPRESGFGDVQDLAGTRLGKRLHWRQGADEDAQVDEEVRGLLAGPLSPDEAVQVALLENRELQATYEQLGIAQADLVQAGLLRNPVFVGRARFPDSSPSGTNLEVGVVQDFLDVLLLSARKSIAEEQFEEAKLSVASQVVDFAARVRAAYFAALGAEQMTAMRKLVVDAALASAELAQRLHEAGNLSDLQLTNEIGLYESARVAWARADTERIATREALTRLLGLWGTKAAWTLPQSLPEIPAEELPLEDLEGAAIESRLDLAALRKASEVLAQALGVTRDWRFLAVADVGVSVERDTDGQWVTGPELSLELPIFDQRQAEIAKRVADLRRADDRVFALAVDIRSEVREARDRLVALRRLVEHYREVVIPVREAAVAFTQQEYNYMLVGAFELILAKQAEYDAYQEYVEAVRDYWITRSDLERATGGRLSANADAVRPTETGAPPSPGKPGHDHPHHEDKGD